ncbi:DNA repair ATPase [Candidatus Photodesmus katoptron]|uniref:ATPase involved in DNA repair n=1 Tax=Candidatus Photodesmus katoptron Akat1 TaxID=1236703 RepID=S3DKQ0_9GAMM|nr:DUF2802 domain-containing protein [Candidatus Photodesmus katoptron]EPE37699.1 ATPase involved in DNA repair [Candidatus Photodesmus katoptron Akat1]KEY90580.1 DNA repair ATPase [Candidatus Photodesmus katoptron]
MIIQSLFSLLGFFIFLFFVFLFFQIRISSLIKKQKQEIGELKNCLRKSGKQLVELRSIIIGIGKRVNEQGDSIKHINERLFELEKTDTSSRLYTRASKMLKLGAGLRELIEECELPKAEAELMMSLQKKLTGKEKIPPLETTPDM